MFGDNNDFVQGSVMQLSKPAVSEVAFVRRLPGRRMLSALSLPVVTDEFTTVRRTVRTSFFARPSIKRSLLCLKGSTSSGCRTGPHLQPRPRNLLAFYLATWPVTSHAGTR